MKNIQRKIDKIREELKEPLPDHQPVEKEKEMATKKAKKKASKKVGKKKLGKQKVGKTKVTKTKARKQKADDDGVTLLALAKEANLSGQVARKKLRDAGITREAGGRWSWGPKSKGLKAARKALGLK